MRRLMRLAAGLLWAGTFASALASAATAGSPPTLEPYKARYQVSYRGLSGGHIEAVLARDGAGNRWRYETRAFPSLLGRVAVSPDARERATMEITPAGVRPLSFEFDDGSADKAKDVRHTFDWSTGRVRGEADGVPFEHAVEPGTQDTASVQAAMLSALLAGSTTEGFPILTGAKLREYRYWPEGRATIVTPYGRFETVVWANQRAGSTRVTRVWHAPALGFLPVQAVQFRKGQAETQMKLVSLER